jgi:hypothetical protein
MAGTLEIRREIHGLIDTMPERSLNVLRPLLDFLVDNGADDDVLSDEERELLEECRRDRQEHPESFVSLADYIKRREAGNIAPETETILTQ